MTAFFLWSDNHQTLRTPQLRPFIPTVCTCVRVCVVLQAYEYSYPAPGGAPTLVASIRDRLRAARLKCGAAPLDVALEDRGFDHGAFVPMMLAR